VSTRLGIFGGTFDPLHIAHLICARQVAYKAELDRVLIVPCRVPPHKPDRKPADGCLRLEMIERSIEGDDVLSAGDIELGRSGPSYSLQTIQAVREQHSDAEPFFIIGADAFAEIATWYHYAELLEQTSFLLMSRPGSRLPTPADAAPDLAGMYREVSVDPPAWAHKSGTLIQAVEVPQLDISASEIRRRVRAGEPIRYLVPDAVLGVIEERGLYR